MTLISKRQFLSQSALLGLGILAPVRVTFASTPLANAIDYRIKQMRSVGKISANERTAWGVYDLVRHRSLATINDYIPMQCASMVKPLVIQAYLMCHYLKSAKLYPLSSGVQEEMHGMIVKSNNEFTNRIIKRLGGPQGVQWMLKKQAPHIFRDIKIVEYIPEHGRTYKNRASVADYNRFLRALWANQLPGAPFLKQMMAIPNLDRIRARTSYVPSSAVVYDKTGSTAMLCGNTGIIECKYGGKSYPYIFTGIIEKDTPTNHYFRWISNRSNVIREISDLCYLYFAKIYHLS